MIDPIDRKLEAAIDAVGRDRVFAMALAYGWNSLDWPPKWVWWRIVEEVRWARARMS